MQRSVYPLWGLPSLSSWPVTVQGGKVGLREAEPRWVEGSQGKEIENQRRKPRRACYAAFLLYRTPCLQVCLSPSEAVNSLGGTGTSLVGCVPPGAGSLGSGIGLWP